jgi:ABC-type nitrate/sulfonate/bicarbonate transport system permease component
VTVRRVLAPAALLAVLIGAWEIYVDSGGVSNFLLPSPHQVVDALYEHRTVLWSNFLVSAEEIVLGAIAAAFAGLALATSMHLWRPWRDAVYPLAIATQAVPLVVIAPTLVLWLGFGLADVTLVIAFVSFFSVVVTTFDRLATVDPALIKLMKTFDATRLRTFWHVELPAALPGVFTGLKLTLVFVPIADILAEQTGSYSGLGYVLETSNSQFQTAEVFAVALILCLFALLLFALLTLAERRLLPWAYQSRGTSDR